MHATPGAPDVARQRPQDVVADLFRDGVRLRVEGNRLAFIDPYAVLTPDRRAAVLRREAELIDLVGWLEEASRELDLRQASIEDVSK